MDILAVYYTANEIAAHNTAIYDAMLRESPRLKSGNFATIGSDDLARLFRLYDERFFQGWLRQSVEAKANWPLSFRLSSTMTSAGGKTYYSRIRQPCGNTGVQYQIAIAAKMLFMNFKHIQRPIEVCGLICTDRLQSLQRIMEHEILHLAELLMWDKSSCNASRFKGLSRNIFGHASTRHAMVTPRELAAVQYAITVGTRVEFDFESLHHFGIVNRIQHRATVIVEDDDGVLFNDGKRYRKYYVPLPMLRVVTPGTR